MTKEENQTDLSSALDNISSIDEEKLENITGGMNPGASGKVKEIVQGPLPRIDLQFKEGATHTPAVHTQLLQTSAVLAATGRRLTGADVHPGASGIGYSWIKESPPTSPKKA